jgi:hypothetical protein
MKTLLLLLLGFSFGFSAPALDAMREFTNADGTTFMAKAQGNQHLNWVQTQDGEILKYNEASKNFEYAEIKEDALVSSGLKYEKSGPNKAAALEKRSKIDKADLAKLWSTRQNAAHKRAKSSKED